jgi:dipeptidyl aminopeptidase/acylaminoacyl peptidase
MTAKRGVRVVALLAAFGWITTSLAAELPVETFFQEYAFSRANLSPGGKYLAAVRHEGTNTFLVTVDLGTFQSQVACSGEVGDYDWVNDDRLLVQGGGDRIGGVFAVDRNGANVKVLLKAAQAQAEHRWIQFYQPLQRSSKDYPFILVERAELDVRDFWHTPKPDVRRVNVLTGKSEIVEKNPGDVTHWLTDSEGEVRAAIAEKGETNRLLYRAAKGEPWKAVLACNILEEDFYPFGLASDNRHVYMATQRGLDTLGLYAFDAVSGNFGDCLWRHEQYDIHSAFSKGRTPELICVTYQGEKLEAHWFDATSKTQFEQVDKALPGLVKVLVDDSDDGLTQLYFAYSDRMPGAYYLFRAGSNQLQRIAECAPWIKPSEMAESKPVTYSARDGLQIHGYLTLPPDRPAKNLPFIILPHGGPWVRDYWGFNREAQFLANRGYAVLQPNYRSSFGYGAAFLKAGYKQYGLKIQDDITDGVQWAIRDGIADPKRTAIFGCSFGGYAAMVGMTQTPEIYRCGINYAGMTDLNRQLRYATSRTSTELVHSFASMSIGDYRKDKDLLKDVSPLNHVTNIQAPVMLIYGGKDHVVDIEQGRRLEKALKSKKKTFEFVYEPLEGHGFTTPTNVFKLYDRIDAFLKKNMQ